MFDLGTTKLLLLGIIALLVVGPKELPGMLRTIGRYVGMMKRQAAEFRTQFDEAMKESEFADLKQQVEDLGREAQSAVKEAETTLSKEVDAVQAEANKTLATIDAVSVLRSSGLFNVSVATPSTMEVRTSDMGQL